MIGGADFLGEDMGAKGLMRHRVLVVGLMLITLSMLLGCEACDAYNNWAGGGRTDDLPVSRDAYSDAPESASPPQVSSSSGEAPAGEPVMEIGNPKAVQNGGTSPTWKTDQPMMVSEIHTYHWNDGQGHAPGTISLEGADGTTYGPWETTGLPGQGGVPNATWVAKPGVVVPEGSYAVIDSDPASWSQNADSEGVGFTWIYATPAK